MEVQRQLSLVNFEELYRQTSDLYYNLYVDHFRWPSKPIREAQENKRMLNLISKINNRLLNLK